MKRLFCQYVHIQPGITLKSHNLVSDPEIVDCFADGHTLKVVKLMLL